MRLSRKCGVVLAALVVPGSAFAAGEHVNDRFGAALAGDGDLVAVGVPGDNSAAFDGGAVYVYVRGGDEWVLDARVVAEDPAPEERLGVALALSGDLLAVASSARYGEATNVRIFRRDGDDWTQVGRVRGAVGEVEYGATLRLDGDVLAVATGPRMQDGSARPGQVEVFREGAGWDRVASLQGAADGGFEFGCGTDIALAGGLLACIVPGQQWSNIGLTLGSRIAVFERDGDEWRPAGDLLEPPEFGFADLVFDGERMITRVLEYDWTTMAYVRTTMRAYLRGDGGWSAGRDIYTFDGYYPFRGTVALLGPWLAFDEAQDGAAGVTLLHLEGDEWRPAVYRAGGMDAYFDDAPALALANGSLWIGTPDAPSRTDPMGTASIGDVAVYALSGEYAEVFRFDPEHAGESGGCRVDGDGRAAWIWLALPGLAVWRRRRT